MNAPTPLPEEREYERFMVGGKLEIVAILRRLIESRSMLSACWGGGRDFGLTSVLAVDAECDELILDCLASPQANRQLIDAGSARLVGVIDGVKLQCQAAEVGEAPFHGAPALCARIPDKLLRLQRRESYRVPAAITCQITLEDEGRVRVLELRTADLSLGGMALLADPSQINAEPGKTIVTCRIPLGKDDAIQTGARIASVIESQTRGGAKQLRIGCRFVGLPGAMEALLARYIAQLERNRKYTR